MQGTVVYRVRVRGRLDPEWSAWFGGQAVDGRPDGDTTLTWRPTDQAELHGLLAQVRDLGLTIVAMETVEAEEVTK